MAYIKQKLSGSTSGRPIKVTQTVAPGTIIHAAVAGATDIDEIWLYATNNHTAALSLSIDWGVAGTDYRFTMSIPAKTGLFLIAPGLILNGGSTVYAFAQTANLLFVSGFVNRITG